MKIKLIVASLIAVAALAGAYVLFSKPVAPAAIEAVAPAAKEFKIDAYKFYFSPDVIAVKQGDKVKITVNNADVPHGIKIPDLGLSGNETIEFTADKAGEFTWYCNVYCGEGHQKMQGRLIVE